MEPEGSLPHLQHPATCPYPQPDRSGSWSSSHLRSILILSFHLLLGLPTVLFASEFPTKTLYAPLLSPTPDKCPTHLVLFDLIALIVFGVKYSSLSSSLCSLLHFFVTSYSLGPNIFSSSLIGNIHSLFSSFSPRDQISQPYKTHNNNN